MHEPSWKKYQLTLVGASRNMVEARALALAHICGEAYPFAAPFLGLTGGFLAGSQTSSPAMFTGLQLSVSAYLHASGLFVAEASGVGGGRASVISPSKVQLAAAFVNRAGEVRAVMRSALLVALSVTAWLCVMTLFMAY